MPSKKDKILKFNQYTKSNKFNSLKKWMNVGTIQKKYTKTEEHISCGYSISTIWAFNNIENKHTFYHWEDCIKTFCNSLGENATNVINFEKKKMLPLTKK